MAYSFNGTSQYLSASSAVVSTAPLTLFAVAYSSSNTDDQHVVAISKSTGTEWQRIYGNFRGVKQIYASTNTGSGAQGAATGTFSMSAINRLTARFAAVDSRTINVDLNAAVTDTTSRSPSGLDNTSIGGIVVNSAATAFWNGNISEVAIWSVALTDEEVMSLSKGFKPQRVRPQSLVFYAPLIRDLQDTRGGLTITNNNSATVADHPRVY